MNDTARNYTSYRVALASGLLGALFATMGWIGALALQLASMELLVTLCVGAFLGGSIHWFQHYVMVAKREKNGEPPSPESEGTHLTRRTVVTIAWATGFAFLGLVTEHLVAHMVAIFLRPFLASLASLLPAGMILGWNMSRGKPKDDNVLVAIASGLFIGLTIAAVTGVIWLLGFGSAPWGPLLAWWGLIGVVTRLLTGDTPNSGKFSPALAAVCVLYVALFLINLLPMTEATYNQFGAFGNVPKIIRIMAYEVQKSPSLPATFWAEAQERFEREHPGKEKIDSAKPVAAATVDTTTRTTPVKPPVPDITGAINRLTAPTEPPSSGDMEHARDLYDLRGVGMHTWIVLLLFALGVSVAPMVERALRPIDYPNSVTYRRDTFLSVTVVVAIVAACVYERGAHQMDTTLPGCYEVNLAGVNEPRSPADSAFFAWVPTRVRMYPDTVQRPVGSGIDWRHMATNSSQQLGVGEFPGGWMKPSNDSVEVSWGNSGWHVSLNFIQEKDSLPGMATYTSGAFHGARHASITAHKAECRTP